MCRGSEYTFFFKGDIPMAKRYMKRFKNDISSGNANQKHNEVLPHTCQNGYHQKIRNSKCW